MTADEMAPDTWEKRSRKPWKKLVNLGRGEGTGEPRAARPGLRSRLWPGPGERDGPMATAVVLAPA